MTVNRRRPARGFTLIEMLVVVTILGILAGVVVMQVKTQLQRTKMSTLKHDLRVMRDLIQQYKVDKKLYPAGLDAIVEAGYMRTVPEDPLTQSSLTWIEVFEEPDPESEDPESEDNGMVDVLSGAPGKDLDGVLYSEY